MSLYIVVWGILCLFTVKGAVARESRAARQLAFWFCFLLLAAMLVLRFGQGTDYFSYLDYYYRMSDTGIHVPVPDVHGEIGYQFLTNVFRLLHLPFEAWVALLSVIQMACLLRFLRLYHIDCVLSLLLAVPTLYLTYFVSGLRQGVAMAVFLGILFPLLEKKNHLGFVAGTVLCMLFHGASVAFLAALVAQKIRKISSLQIFTVVAWAAGLFLASPPVQSLIAASDSWAIRYYLQDADMNPAAAAERLLFLVLVTWLYEKLRRLGKTGPVFLLAYRCYLMAMALYGLLICNGTTASRMASMMRYVEIYLLAWALGQMTRFSRYLLTLVLVALQTFMLCKNIQTAIDQGGYRSSVTIRNFPYVSVFNEEEIFAVREIAPELLDHPECRILYARKDIHQL